MIEIRRLDSGHPSDGGWVDVGAAFIDPWSVVDWSEVGDGSGVYMISFRGHRLGPVFTSTPKPESVVMSVESGRVVCLKSGGPAMTVRCPEMSGHGEYVCDWFDGGKLRSGTFRSDQLTAA